MLKGNAYVYSLPYLTEFQCVSGCACVCVYVHQLWTLISDCIIIIIFITFFIYTISFLLVDLFLFHFQSHFFRQVIFPPFLLLYLNQCNCKLHYNFMERASFLFHSRKSLSLYPLFTLKL